jgi:hypothetical protein
VLSQPWRLERPAKALVSKKYGRAANCLACLSAAFHTLVKTVMCDFADARLLSWLKIVR